MWTRDCARVARAQGPVVVAMLLAMGGTCGSVRAENRSIDGTGNNLTNPAWGGSFTQLLRFSAPAYADGMNDPARAAMPSARLISNTINAQAGSIPNNRGMSDWVWQWGQFMDHDLSLTDAGSPSEAFNISVPTGDPFFDPSSTGTQTIGLTRSIYDHATGTGPGNPRQQVNQLTSYIDGSMVYGSDASRADWLRAGTGGLLKTTAHPSGPMMPFNDGTQGNAMGNSTSFFVAGDVRSNEQAGLTAVQTLFVREHNRLATEIGTANPGMTSDQVYERARKVVGAEIQAITYNEFIPALFGSNALPAYAGYNPNVDASVTTEFSTAAFRIGHTMLSPTLARVDNAGNTIPEGNLSLQNSFFNASNITGTASGIDGLLKGLASQAAQEIDPQITDGVRNFLFGPPGAGGFDLASLNIQRGREHGLCDFSTMRQAYGLPAIASFTDITSDPTVQAELAAMYPDVNSIDPWIGMLAEDHVGDGSVGATMRAIILDQFERSRDGDRFFFMNDPDLAGEVSMINGITLADIIRENSGISNIQGNVFFVTSIPAPGAASMLMLAIVSGARRRRRGA